ncbi:hypothetical protein [Gemmatimonas sp.]|uniref:hypothetical protein n=1 Tax=Gemmatimonas sp. TaxID=1962908 RepID=UPI003DA22411
MAHAQGLSEATVRHIWQCHQLKPHVTKRFKLSRNKAFVETLVDNVGLSLNPPDRARVLSVDEKSQKPALDWTLPDLPLKTAPGGTMTHDDKRNRDDDVVRRAKHAGWQRDRRLHAAPSASEVHPLSQDD